MMIHDQEFVRDANATSGDLASPYVTAIAMIERLDRKLLEVIGDELERRGHRQINATQALLLHRIGDQRLRLSDLHKKGCYLGSNVSYSTAKLVQLGLLVQKKGQPDKRTIEISVTEKGREIGDLVQALYQRQLDYLEKVAYIGNEEFNQLNATLHRLERFWNDQLLYRM